MGTAAKTATMYPKSALSGAKLHELIMQHNAGVQDDHAICALLDQEGGDVDTDYEAQLTALEIPFDGYTPTEAAEPGTNTPGFLTEKVMRQLVRQHNARVDDIRKVVDKLNADDGVTDEDFTSTALKINALGETPGGGEYPVHFGGPGTGISADLLQALVDEHNKLTQDWHDIAAKLDADNALAGEYESKITARVIAEIPPEPETEEE